MNFRFLCAGTAAITGFVIALSAYAGQPTSFNLCDLGKVDVIERSQVNGQTVFSNRAKSAVYTASCGKFSTPEIDELLNTFPDRKKITSELSSTSLQSSGDSFARMYFHVRGQNVIQLAVVGKSSDFKNAESAAIAAVTKLSTQQK